MITSSRAPAISLEKISVWFRVPLDPVGKFKEFAIQLLKGRIRYRQVYAVNELSLEIPQGEFLGIIGRNGAGKSTLLKVIARVLHPKSGRVVVWGKIAPLLDIGAGFHPEMSGRENIFLNGAILGYTHQQMLAKYDRIVAFAELAEFIEAPMRTYSSGMWARLGFAVATDERPDILLVDEILAVGDEAFQQKCLQRIIRYKDEGTTIVMVSHNLEQVRKFCTRAAWLDHGRLRAWGKVDSVVDAYTADPS